MIFRFPPSDTNYIDSSFLVEDGKTFAKLKTESKVDKRMVYLTEHTVIFVLEGTKLLHFGDKTVTIGKDEVLFLKKGIYVMAEYIEGGLDFEALMIFVPLNILQECFHDHISPKLQKDNPPFVKLAINKHLVNYKYQLRQYFQTPVLSDRHLLRMKQKEAILLMMRSDESKKVSGFINTIIRNEPEDIKYIMHEYLLKPLNIGDFANLSNRSMASFKRDFKKIFDTTPRQWINQKRLQYANILLSNTSMRISEIADECGFESASYFIRLFRKQYGATPSSVRTKSTID